MPPREQMARFVADLEAHGATVRIVSHDEVRRELAHTSDDGENPFAKRKR